MDPIGCAASVVNILQAAATVTQIISVLKHGHEERAQLQSEVDNVSKVLLGIQDQFNNADPDGDLSWFRPIEPLFSKDGEIANLHQILSQIVAKLNIAPDTPLAKIKQNVKWIIDRKTVEELTERIQLSKINISLALNRASVQIGRDTNAITKETNANVKHVQQLVDAAYLNRVIQWISPLDFRDQQSQKRGLEHTGAWFLGSRAFTGWADTRAPSLWCHGIPGSGKTFIASMAYSKLCQQYSDTNTLIMIVFCAFDDTNTHTAEGIMSSLLRQALENRDSMSDTMQELHQKCSSAGGNSRPTTEQLQAALKAEFEHVEKVFAVIDGLDEMPEEKQRSDLLNMLEAIDPRLQLMVSSRPLLDVKAWFTGLERIHRYSILPTSELFPESSDEDDRLSEGLSWTELDDDDDGEDETYYGCDSCVITDADFVDEVPPIACYRCQDDSCGRLVCANCYDQYSVCLGCNAEKAQYLYIWPREVDIKARPSDLETYVKHRISDKRELERKIERAARVGRDLQCEIVKAVVASARQMFLLAKLHMDNIVKLDTPNDILRALPDLSNDINEIFQGVFRRISAFDVAPQIRRLVTLVAFAHKPLTTPALEHAIAIETGNTSLDPMDLVDIVDLVNKSLSLLTVGSNDAIRLSHETVGEFIRRQNTDEDRNGHTLFARICVGYIRRAGSIVVQESPGLFEDIRQKCLNYPLLSYAALFWGHHARLGNCDSTRSLAHSFLTEERSIATAAQLMWYDGLEHGSGWDSEDGICGLHLAAHFGLIEATASFLADGEPANMIDSMRTTPLMYAVGAGHQDIIATLLHARADASIKCKRGRTALHRACARLDAASTRQLTEHPGDIAINVLDPVNGQLSSLHLMASWGASEIVGLLLTRDDININLRDGIRTHHAPLYWSVANGSLSVTEQLLNDPRIDIDIRNQAGSTALSIACQYNYVDSISSLLEHGGPPMLRAIDWNSMNAVQLLVERGIDYHFEDFFRRGVLHACAVNNRPQILRYLLATKKDLDPNQQGDRGETPLHDAAARGYTGTVRTLLDFGARTYIRDDAGRSPLRAAREHNQTRVLALLVEARKREQECGMSERGERDALVAETSVMSHHRRTVGRIDTLEEDDLPIHAKVRLYEAPDLRRYLDGLQENLRPMLDLLDNDSKQTALHVAVSECTLETVTALLEYGADPNIQDMWGLTSLHMAAVYDNTDAAEALLHFQASVDKVDKLGRTPLQIALQSSRGRRRHFLACLIVKSGARIDDEHANELIWTLQYAVEQNDIEVVKILCAQGVPCHLRIGSNFTPYQTAKKKGFEDMADLLLNELCRRQKRPHTLELPPDSAPTPEQNLTQTDETSVEPNAASEVSRDEYIETKRKLTPTWRTRCLRSFH